MKRVLEILSVLSTILFVGNYSLCDYFYFNDHDNWWKLKQNIYNVDLILDRTTLFLLIIFFCNYLKLRRLAALTLLGLLLNLSNIIDRLLFDINTFEKDDIVMIILAILLSSTCYLSYGRNRSNI